MTYQHTDGSYRAYLHERSFYDDGSTQAYEGVHYTSVIYIAKSMLELAMVERKNEKASNGYLTAYERHFQSAERAIDNLSLFLDNIDTEGEITFEDGMISCSALQIGMFALLQEDTEKNKNYCEAARKLISKHRCLEQMLVPDCRINGGTIRFWEAQYDILLDKNMINSPHGWTSWKTYATYYLYLLTGDVEYLVQTMNTLGACMQMVDLQTGDLRWAFICDPFVKTNTWVESSEKGRGEKKQLLIGEQYMDMISGWWKTIDDNSVGAYPSMPLITSTGVVKSDNIGGCCDNDVHEHFKCLMWIDL